jgi:lipoprotein-releasing system permease protein
MNLKNKATSVEINLNKNIDTEEFIVSLKKNLGNQYKIKDRQQQNETIYKITQSEKWSGFLILSFILLIAIFNVVGSVTVLIIEKKKDIETFSYLGFPDKLIRKIFLYEGMLISVVGGAIGLLSGLILVLIQQRYGIIPMEGGFAVSSFPVALKVTDFVAVYAMVLAIGFAATVIPVNRISKNILKF